MWQTAVIGVLAAILALAGLLFHNRLRLRGRRRQQALDETSAAWFEQKRQRNNPESTDTWTTPIEDLESDRPGVETFGQIQEIRRGQQ